MTIQDLNLGFLYEEKKGVIFGVEHPFDIKWDGEYVKFSNYIKNTSIINYFELMLYAFKEEYPRDYWIGGTILKRGYSSDFKELKEDYTILDGKYFIYPEIKTFKSLNKLDKDGFEYRYEYVYQFNKDLPLKKVIEEVFKEKEYTIEKEKDFITYRLENSPIDSIKLGNDFVSLTINEDYYIHRML